MRDPLGRALNRNCIVENRPGGSTVIAAEFVARAPADGHTLLVGGTALLAALRSNLPFDPIRDFAAVAGLGTLPYVFSVHPSGPAKDINDLIALARARPGKLAYASNGYGTMQHLTAELLMSRAAIRMKHVAFQGGGPAVMAVLGGQVGLVVSGIAPILAHVQSGRLRALAITSRARSTVLPDVPTVIESGLPDFEMTARVSTLAPAATPRPAVERLSAEIMRIVLLPEVKASMARVGYEIGPIGAAELEADIRNKVEKWKQLAKAVNLKVD
jgi:tripartite-type tricarboxylate transporter receptor subunit TctC